jgi:hypothetical protein
VFLCLVTEQAGEPVAMRWAARKIIPTHGMHPDHCIWSYREADSQRNPECRYPVRWEFGDRAGVLWKSEKGQWRLAWFEPPKTRLKGRTWLLGQGRWEVSLRDADEVERPSLERLKAFGLDYALTRSLE